MTHHEAASVLIYFGLKASDDTGPQPVAPTGAESRRLTWIMLLMALASGVASEAVGSWSATTLVIESAIGILRYGGLTATAHVSPGRRFSRS